MLPTYARLDVTFTDGEGSWLTDADGKRYLDLFAGIAVVGLGHQHPAPLAAAHAQLERLWHVSNLYWTEPMSELASLLSDRFGGAQAFFCNSGAESIEAALKWARKVTGRTELVALEGSFHGRTLGALSVTGQPAKRAAFEPLIPGVRFATPDTLADHVGPATAAILLEPVQGEGGVHPLAPEVLAQARALADEHGALLILDEVQTGVGRSGAFFAWQTYGVKPDAVTLAKGLANGLPIGALPRLRRRSDRVRARRPRLDLRRQPGHLRRGVRRRRDDRRRRCSSTCGRSRRSSQRRSLRSASVRGLGLLLAVELDRPAAPVVEAALEHGLVIGSAGERTLRLTPPLTLTAEEAEHGIQLLKGVLE